MLPKVARVCTYLRQKQARIYRTTITAQRRPKWTYVSDNTAASSYSLADCGCSNSEYFESRLGKHSEPDMERRPMLPDISTFSFAVLS
jgi:hypothetical protein